MALKTEEEMRQGRKDGAKESGIERYFIAQAKRYGCKQRKNTHFYAEDGWPDRVIIWQGGTTDWPELKRPKGGKLRPRQTLIIEELTRLGAYAPVLHTKELVDEYFRTRARQLNIKPAATRLRAKGSRLMSAADYVGSL